MEVSSVPGSMVEVPSSSSKGSEVVSVPPAVGSIKEVPSCSVLVVVAVPSNVESMVLVSSVLKPVEDMDTSSVVRSGTGVIGSMEAVKEAPAETVAVLCEVMSSVAPMMEVTSSPVVWSVEAVEVSSLVLVTDSLVDSRDFCSASAVVVEAVLPSAEDVASLEVSGDASGDPVEFAMSPPHCCGGGGCSRHRSLHQPQCSPTVWKWSSTRVGHHAPAPAPPPVQPQCSAPPAMKGKTQTSAVSGPATVRHSRLESWCSGHEAEQ